MNPSTVQAYLPRIEKELRGNILPFWLTHTRDYERGGFFGEISHDLKVSKDAERGSLLTSRILWTFASAQRHYPQSDYLMMAKWAYEDLVTRFWDAKNGGVYWSASAEGKPLRTRKQVYGQAFAIYAMTEYFRVTQDPVALDRSIQLYKLLEQHARERQFGGYLEAFRDDWGVIEDVRLSEIDMNSPKSQNTHLHVMEAYTNLLRVWPDEGLRRTQRDLVETMITRILNNTTHHLGLFFSKDWKLETDRISYGHDIEAAWLLHEAALVVGDADLLKRVRQVAVEIARVTAEQAIEPDGSLLYEGTPKGVTLTYKEWWPQAEGAVGFVDAYQINGDEKYLTTGLRLWDFIEHNLVDHERGEWYRAVTREGEKNLDPKVSFWKCPYHNGRACLELAARLKKIG